VAISGSGDSSRTSSSGSTSESGSEIANIPKSPAWVVNDDNFYKALSWETSGNLQYYIFLIKNSYKIFQVQDLNMK